MLVQKNILSDLIISIMNTIPNECTQWMFDLKQTIFVI